MAPMTGVAWGGSMPKCVAGARWRSFWTDRSSLESDLRSMPAQKAGSAPVSTMHPTSSRAVEVR